jgi:hypothetical protein
MVEPMGEGLRVHATSEQVGRAALEAGAVLTDLRSGGAGLEDLVLELTSTTQRDAVAGGPQHDHMPAMPPMPPVDSPTAPIGGPHA